VHLSVAICLVRSTLYSSLKHPVREINHLCLLNNTVKALNKILVHRIFLNIVVPVFLVCEFDNKGVCYAILSSVTKVSPRLEGRISIED
jgi:hypothetical protein